MAELTLESLARRLDEVERRLNEKEPSAMGQFMTDAITKKPLRVSTESTMGPYIMTPVSRMDEIQRLLDSRGIRYSVEENVISMDGGPEIGVINFGREEDTAAIQAILDSGLSEENTHGPG